MITIRDWIPTIPEEDKHIAYVGEGQSVEKEFFVTGEGWEKFRDWTYHLDMAFDLSGVTARDSREVVMVKEDATVSEPDMQNKITSKTTTTETYTLDTVTMEPYAETDIAYLYKEVEADGLRLHWNILRQHTQLAGKLTANLRAVGPDEEIKKSALMVFEVDPSVPAVPAAPPTESEFEQMEQRMAQVCEEMRALQMDIADNADAVNTQALEAQQSATQAQQSATQAQQSVVQAEQYAIVAADYVDDAADLAQDAEDSAALAQTAATNANESFQQAQKQSSSASSYANTAKQAMNDAQKYSNQVAGNVNTAKDYAAAAQNSANFASAAAQNAASSAETAYNDMLTSQQNVTAMQGQLTAAEKAAEDAEESAKWAQACSDTAEGSARRASEAAVTLMEVASRIPPEYTRNDTYYILRVNGGGDGLEFVNIAQDMYMQTWVIPYLLPRVDTDHDGMTLKVVNGKWTAVNP